MSNEREDVRLITHVTYMVKKSCIQHRWPNGPPAAADRESRERLAGLLDNLLYLKKVQSGQLVYPRFSITNPLSTVSCNGLGKPEELIIRLHEADNFGRPIRA